MRGKTKHGSKEHGKLIKNALKDTPKSVIGNYTLLTSQCPIQANSIRIRFCSTSMRKIKPTNGAVYKLCAPRLP